MDFRKSFFFRKYLDVLISDSEHGKRPLLLGRQKRQNFKHLHRLSDDFQMGLLDKGVPIDWAEAKKHLKQLREFGVRQFIEGFQQLKEQKGEFLRWGDEIEYMVAKFDHANKRVQLSLAATEYLKKFEEMDHENEDGPCATHWVHEFAEYMIEATPGRPYKHTIGDIGFVECNMKKRRKLLQSKLAPDETVLMMTCFPRLGCPNFTIPSYDPTSGFDSKGNAALSLFFPNEAVTQGHPRFITLATNIKARREEKVCINVPVFRDVNTPNPFIDPSVAIFPNETKKAIPNHIYMDAMGFGMGCCCLQVTFQASNVDEARYLYDNLCPLTPILLAISAGSPVWKGFLSDIDCRWEVIASSVDDRNPAERGEREPGEESSHRIATSRYSTLDSYLSPHSKAYNDLDLVKDEKFYSHLIEAGVDELLAAHVAHLFIRDPLVVFDDRLGYQENDAFHFETIQSTNWNNMRFKMPPPGSDIGWRVEFRTPEVGRWINNKQKNTVPSLQLQFTEFENAALVTFILLLTRVILSFRIHLLVPVSMVKENMRRAQTRDAVLKQKFFFNTNASMGVKSCQPDEPLKEVDFSLIHEMSIDEIINGREDKFVGLIPLVKSYIDTLDVDHETCCKLSCYLHLLSCRASGKLMTNAAWIRNFVSRHPTYKKDSVVTDEITYDMLCKIQNVFDLTKSSASDVIIKILHEYSR